MRAVALAVVAALTLTGCVEPSRTDTDYKRKAANTAEAVASAVQTARLTSDAVRTRNIFGPYATRAIAEAEEDAQAAQAAFDAVQPPSEQADDVHERLDALVQGALNLLRLARVAIRRGDFAAVAALGDELAVAGDALDAFQESVAA